MTSELPRISHALATGRFQISAYERCLGQDVAMHGFLERGFAGLAQIRKQGIEGKEPMKITVPSNGRARATVSRTPPVVATRERARRQAVPHRNHQSTKIRNHRMYDSLGLFLASR
jgi:hypothetical protein